MLLVSVIFFLFLFDVVNTSEAGLLFLLVIHDDISFTAIILLIFQCSLLFNIGGDEEVVPCFNFRSYCFNVVGITLYYNCFLMHFSSSCLLLRPFSCFYFIVVVGVLCDLFVFVCLQFL